MDARKWCRFAAPVLLCGTLCFPAVVQARGECPFLRDPAYWARTPVAPAPRDGLAIGTLNVFRLLDAAPVGRMRPMPGQLAARIARIARYIVRDMGAPAVLGLQEVGSDAVLRDLVAALARESGRSYGFLAGDKVTDSDIRSALLYDTRLRIGNRRSLFAAPAGSADPRFDRLPLAVDVDPGALLPRMPSFTLVVVHLKSQRGLERQEEAVRVLAKRRAQALRLAAWVHAQAGNRLIVLGDFNASATGADDVRGEPVRILLAGGDLVDVAARFLVPAQRWTYRYHCSLQELDHLLVTPAMASVVDAYAIARGDTCLRAQEPCNVAGSVSDHDGVVLRLGSAGGAE